MSSRILRAAVFGVFALSLTGCPHKAEVKQPEAPMPPTQQPPTTQSDEPSLRGKDYQEVAALSKVYFDLDQAVLRSDARDILQKNYQEISKHADWEILVEGHSDERGTTEYNLALGQRRAASVRQYYMTLGLAGTKVATISYGKENPACNEHNDSCWSQNRRGVTKVRMSPSHTGGSTGGSSNSNSAEPTLTPAQ